MEIIITFVGYFAHVFLMLRIARKNNYDVDGFDVLFPLHGIMRVANLSSFLVNIGIILGIFWGLGNSFATMSDNLNSFLQTALLFNIGLYIWACFILASRANRTWAFLLCLIPGVHYLGLFFLVSGTTSTKIDKKDPILNNVIKLLQQGNSVENIRIQLLNSGYDEKEARKILIEARRTFPVENIKKS
ncbi:hypothetical protein KAI58_00825 [Candidatus Gracilibacteria bacterium]|nr:hypothetical protein [Candidatus Gracilibacteria bacterium]